MLKSSFALLALSSISLSADAMDSSPRRLRFILALWFVFGLDFNAGTEELLAVNDEVADGSELIDASVSQDEAISNDGASSCKEVFKGGERGGLVLVEFERGEGPPFWDFNDRGRGGVEDFAAAVEDLMLDLGVNFLKILSFILGVSGNM